MFILRSCFNKLQNILSKHNDQSLGFLFTSVLYCDFGHTKEDHGYYFLLFCPIYSSFSTDELLWTFLIICIRVIHLHCSCMLPTLFFFSYRFSLQALLLYEQTQIFFYFSSCAHRIKSLDPSPVWSWRNRFPQAQCFTTGCCLVSSRSSIQVT